MINDRLFAAEGQYYYHVGNQLIFIAETREVALMLRDLIHQHGSHVLEVLLQSKGG